MGKKKYNDPYCLAGWLFSILFLAGACYFMRWSKEEPIEIKDDSRIQVHMNYNVLYNALNERATNWGTYSSEWAPLNDMDESSVFVIEAKADQLFYKILHTDDAAVLLARDYPYLFSMEELEDGGCRFEMACNQGDYVVFPTWLLVKLIEMKVLLFPEGE